MLSKPLYFSLVARNTPKLHPTELATDHRQTATEIGTLPNISFEK